MNDLQRFELVVIGQGYAGLTAAKLAATQGLHTASVEANCMGGWIMNINKLDPGPEGTPESGAELASSLSMSNTELGVTDVLGNVTSLNRNDDGLWIVKTEEEAYTAPNVIIASGGRRRTLGVPGETEFLGQGVSECADCDGPLFRDAETIIVGGGDAAFQEALTLAEFAGRVTILIRGSAPRARTDFQQRVAANPRIVQRLHTRLLAIEGQPGAGVESVRIQTEGSGESTLAAKGVFIFVGLEPNTGFVPTEIARDQAGALITSEDCATALPGLWAIGAVRSGYKGLLTHAAQEAERAIAALTT